MFVSITPSWADGGKTIKWIRQAAQSKVPALERKIIETSYWVATPIPRQISSGLIGVSAKSGRFPGLNPQMSQQLTTHVNRGKLTPRLSSSLPSGAFILNPKAEMTSIENLKYYSEMRQKRLKMETLFTLFRGIKLGDNYIAKLKDLLRHGSVTTESLNDEIWFSVDITEAMDYARFPSPRVPVLIALKSRDGGERTFVGTFVFEEDIPAQQQEVFAYLTYQGKAGWYHISLTPQEEILAVPLDIYLGEHPK